MSIPALVSPTSGTESDLIVHHAVEAQSLISSGRWLMLLGVVPVALWLGFAPLASAVVAQGYVKVDQNRRTVQHAEGGIVSKVLVRDGQHVSANAPLVELGDVAVAADRARLGYRLVAEKASAARLEAEQQLIPNLVWSADVQKAAQSDPSLAAHLRKEMDLFVAHRQTLISQRDLLRQQRVKIHEEILTLNAQITNARASLSAQKRELKTNNELVQDGFVAQTRILQLEASVADYGVKMEEKRSELVRAEQRIVDIDMKLRGIENDYRQQASDLLKQTVVRIQEIEQELRKATDAATRQVVRAPAEGEVIGLRVTTPGTVLAPREPIADIVPANPKLLIEARIRPEDVARVHVGQASDLRFTAYKYRTTNVVPGRLTYISGDRLVDTQANAAYYTVHVEVEAEEVAKATNGEKLQAGMPAEVYIKGGERTPLQYMFEPVTQVLHRAGRER